MLAVHYLAEDPGNRFYDIWLYNALILGGGLMCVARGLAVRRERLAWLVLGAGMLSWSAADLLWSLHYANQDAPPYPSVSDALWLAFYPAAYVGLMVLVRRRVAGITGAMWLDGAIGALAVAALAAAAALDPIVEATSGNTAQSPPTSPIRWATWC